MPDVSIERWKKYLRYDPTRWLLETNDPSILFWYQLDIAHRPEDAPGVIEMRQRVLYSDPVQQIFAAQNEWGYWGEPTLLANNYYASTFWNIALLAELGIPRTSRRARNACEFMLQNFMNADGVFEGLNIFESGILVYGLHYFMQKDPRVVRAAFALGQRLQSADRTEFGWMATIVGALWGLIGFAQEPAFQDITQSTCNLALRYTINNEFFSTGYSFPSFVPGDELTILRLLSAYDCFYEPWTSHHKDLEVVISTLTDAQNELAQWRLVGAHDSILGKGFWTSDQLNRWITLNALRVITKLVLSEKKED